MTPIVFS